MANPVLEKITPEHIDKLLAAEDRDNEREHERFRLRYEERKEKQQLAAEYRRDALASRIARDRINVYCLAGLAVATLLLVFGLCWLFLSHNHPEYIVAVLGSVISFAGGIGVGRSKVFNSKEPPRKHDEEPKPSE